MNVAVYIAPRSLYWAVLPSVKSLLFHTPVDKVYLLIEDADFPEELPQDVEIMDVSKQKYFPKDDPEYMYKMKFVLADLFPKLDRVLSLDVATFVIKDISDIWSLPLTNDYYFSASVEPTRCIHGLFYTNTGVVLFNLKKMRDGKAKELVDVTNGFKLPLGERKALNYLCQGHILNMPSMYNACRFTKPPQENRIVHYDGYNKWDNRPEYIRYNSFSLEYVNSRRYAREYVDNT